MLFRSGQPAPKVCCRLFCFSIRISSAADSSLLLLQIGDVDRCTVYVSLAPGMESPAGEDPLEEDAARCTHYTSSEEEQARPVPTTEERVAGKRPLPADPLPTPTLPADPPAESSQAPKRRRLMRIVDDDDDEEAAPSLVRRPRSRPDSAPATTDRVPATLLLRALSRWGRRRRPAGQGGGSARPTVDLTCKCSTYVFWRFF